MRRFARSAANGELRLTRMVALTRDDRATSNIFAPSRELNLVERWLDDHAPRTSASPRLRVNKSPFFTRRRQRLACRIFSRYQVLGL
jgi:hypothetical protein